MGITKTVSRPTVVMSLPTAVLPLCNCQKNTTALMTGNPLVPAPFPSMVTVPATALANIAALEAAETVALTRVTGSVAKRNALKEVVIKDAHGNRLYIQSLVDANPANAIAIAKSVAMTIKITGSHTKAKFVATNGTVSGTVNLKAKSAGNRSAYNWQQLAADGTTWLHLPCTIGCSTVVTGLTPGVSYSFRFSAVTKDGTSSYSQVAVIIAQ